MSTDLEAVTLLFVPESEFGQFGARGQAQGNAAAHANSSRNTKRRAPGLQKKEGAGILAVDLRRFPRNFSLVYRINPVTKPKALSGPTVQVFQTL